MKNVLQFELTGFEYYLLIQRLGFLSTLTGENVPTLEETKHLLNKFVAQGNTVDEAKDERMV